MFSPSFSLTPKILNGLITIEVATKIVDLAPINPDKESRMKLEALARKINANLRFLGSSIDQDDVAKVVRDEPGRDDSAGDTAMRAGVVAKEKEVQQLLDMLNANRLISQTTYLATKFKQFDYGEKELKQINTLLGERIYETGTLGAYRTDEITEVGELNIPVAIEVPYQMEDLFRWFACSDRADIHPILKAGVMMFELLRISPFVKNNLMSASLFFDLVVSSEGFCNKQLLVFEEEMFKNREKFYAILATGNKTEQTEWLEFVTKVMADSAEKTKVKVMNLVGEAPLFKSDGGRAIALSERQIAVMEEMTVRNEMTLKEVREILPMVSDDTILRDLKGLIEKKLIRKKGKTKGSVYVLGKIRGFK